MLLITGSNGQLGTMLSKVFPHAFTIGSKHLDITNQDAVARFVEQNSIHTIINCAAYTNVDQAEDNAELCRKVNVDGPRNLAKTKAAIIHISTDYVFDGSHCQPYTEKDTPNPLSVYGITKLAGENAVLEEAESAIVIRTSWMHSPVGHNFVKTIKNLGAERKSIDVVYDQIGTPTYAGDLAQAIFDIVPQIHKGKKEIYHYSNEGICSWYDLAHEIIKHSGYDCRINPIESKDYPRKAKRPLYNILNKSKIKTDFGITIPHWRESLEKCLNQF